MEPHVQKGRSKKAQECSVPCSLRQMGSGEKTMYLIFSNIIMSTLLGVKTTKKVGIIDYIVLALEPAM